jgi:hypothetical protein
MSLLEKFAGITESFRPSTIQEFLALQIARKLDDAESFRWYVHALAGTPQADLLLALRKAFHRESSPESSRAVPFREELKNLSNNFQPHA